MTTSSPDNRSLRTQQAIVRAAETLFARHGVEGVSLNTITRAARQSNRNAIQYHFGGKNGLLQAIFDKHSTGVAERRAAIIDELAARDEPTEIIVATAMVWLCYTGPYLALPSPVSAYVDFNAAAVVYLLYASYYTFLSPRVGGSFALVLFGMLVAANMAVRTHRDTAWQYATMLHVFSWWAQVHRMGRGERYRRQVCQVDHLAGAPRHLQ